LFVKKCLRCGRPAEDSAVYCPACGDSIFEPIDDSPRADDAGAAAPDTDSAPQTGASRQQYAQYQYGAPQQPPYGGPRQPPYGPPPYGRYGQPQYPPRYYPMPRVKEDPATVGDYLLFALFMIIPVFNLVYLILAAVGGPRYKPSMTNCARAVLILLAIGIVIVVILGIILAVSNAAFPSYYGYKFY